MKGFIIGGTHSGIGKTTVALGLMMALNEKGLTVQPFKVGPDYIDPNFHRLVCDRPSYNLDTWMMGKERAMRTFLRVSGGADISVVEGVMGLFDGKDGRDEEGSTAHIAKVLNIPIVLVVDVRSMARSAGALVYGYENFDPDIKIDGVIFNMVGSERHYRMLRDAVEERCKTKVLGFIPRDKTITIPERHLGLVTSQELRVESSEFRVSMERLKCLIEENVDLDALLSLSSISRKPPTPHDLEIPKSEFRNPKSEFRPKIAVAMDKAFFFYYQENLDILKEMGAELIYFSPLKDKELLEDITGIYIGGGYPELYAEVLETNCTLKDRIKVLAEEGLPVYAECGGLMYLGKALRDLGGKTFKMVGLFPYTSRMLPKGKTLGYREIEAIDGCPFLGQGQRVRGHEFHYSEIETPDAIRQMPDLQKVYRLTENSSSPDHRPSKLEGYLYKNTLASYIHLHFASNLEFVRRFISLSS